MRPDVFVWQNDLRDLALFSMQCRISLRKPRGDIRTLSAAFPATYQQLIANNVKETTLHLNISFTYPGTDPAALM